MHEKTFKLKMLLAINALLIDKYESDCIIALINTKGKYTSLNYY